MNLFNKRILEERIKRFSFPVGNHQKIINNIIIGWQVALSQHNLDKTKEKSVQGEFLIKFFESVLGYTSHTSGKSEWNLISSPKTEVDSQEADGSLGFFTIEQNITKAVIELKDAKTSLGKKQIGREKGYTPIEQGYLYATKFDYCNWIIVSNFKEIRLYNKTRTQDFYETFDVLKLNELDEFKRFYYILCKENLISQIGNSTIDALVKETNFQEENITKEFYKKYKETRYKLFEHITNNNPNISKVIILEKTQKIIDRIIFVSFCEDLGLLPPNIFRRLLEAVKQSYDLSENKIWNQVKGLFHSINIGNPPMNINKFNGGLFSEDGIFDNLLIKDEVLIELLKISDYDFESEINVNILGHIFEQSISDIEEMKADINELESIKKEGKRKKEGIYYTPEYITKYIVEQAIGGWLQDRKEDLGFNTLTELSEEDYKSIKLIKGKIKANKEVEAHIKLWESYREILQNIKVLDPACGSGAFLIQAFDYLYKEGQLVNDELGKLKKGQRQIFDLDKHILTNNIYGVDLNEESVEITKLSLWLKTANKGKELTALDENIKCGNSLIDSFEIVENKAFKWENEFKDILLNNGFDVVIGNPPYVRHENLNFVDKQYFLTKYSEISNTSADLYIYFFFKAFSLIKPNGYLGFITPNKWMERNYGTSIRKYFKEFQILKIINYSELKIFKEVSVEPAITIIKKTKNNKNIEYTSIKSLDQAKNTQNYFYNSYKKNNLLDEIWKFPDVTLSTILKKFSTDVISLKEYTNKGVFYGIKTGLNEAFIIDKNIMRQILSKDSSSKEIIKPMLEGDDFSKWSLKNPQRYMIATEYDLDVPTRYPAVFEHLKKFQDKLMKRQDQGKNWWNLRACEYYGELDNPKLIYYHTALKHNFYYDEKGFYISANCYFIPSADRYLQCLLNSKLFHIIKRYFFPAFGDSEMRGRIRLDKNKMEDLPIKNPDIQITEVFKELVIRISELSLKFQDSYNNILELLRIEYGINNFNQKLSVFYRLEFDEFTQELKNQKIILTLNKQEILQKWFLEKKTELNDLENEINSIDQAINNSIYNLYKLTDEEIQIVRMIV